VSEGGKPIFYLIDGERNHLAVVKGALTHVAADGMVTLQVLAQVKLEPDTVSVDGAGLAVAVMLTITPDHQTWPDPETGPGKVVQDAPWKEL
jgi:hypothetical protein